MKKLFVVICCIFCLCGCGNNQKAEFNYTNVEELEKGIITNFNKILGETDLTSSNPFDYTKSYDS